MINNILNDFLTQLGYADGLTAAYQLESDSYYEPRSDRDLVVLGGLTNRRADELFMDYCKELGLTLNISIETISFLHEVGHYLTLDLLDDDEFFESEMTKLILDLESEETDEAFMKYFTCPIEFAATSEAVTLCQTHSKAILELDKQIRKALYEN